jgi:hypothetical protein
VHGGKELVPDRAPVECGSTQMQAQVQTISSGLSISGWRDD